MTGKRESSYVLILVLVEHALRARSYSWQDPQLHVLILVLVEHTLRGKGKQVYPLTSSVLILVLVEHTLRACQMTGKRESSES